jgi:hypothetical protein
MGGEEKMIDINILFDIANVAFLVGTILLIRAVLKNRKILNGYDPTGSFLTLFALLVCEVCYLAMGNLVSVLLSTVTIAYWVLAFAFSVRNLLQERREIRAVKELVLGK